MVEGTRVFKVVRLAPKPFATIVSHNRLQTFRSYKIRGFGP